MKKFLRNFAQNIAEMLRIRERLVYFFANDLERELLNLQKESFLTDSGWINSFISNKSVDTNGNALPWFTFSAIFFLTGRLTDKINIFEFGAGASTEFWTKRPVLWIMRRKTPLWTRWISCGGN